MTFLFCFVPSYPVDIQNESERKGNFNTKNVTHSSELYKHSSMEFLVPLTSATLLQPSLSDVPIFVVFVFVIAVSITDFAIVSISVLQRF